jgi:hypothetical protein
MAADAAPVAPSGGEEAPPPRPRTSLRRLALGGWRLTEGFRPWFFLIFACYVALAVAASYVPLVQSTVVSTLTERTPPTLPEMTWIIGSYVVVIHFFNDVSLVWLSNYLVFAKFKHPLSCALDLRALDVAVRSPAFVRDEVGINPDEAYPFQARANFDLTDLYEIVMRDIISVVRAVVLIGYMTYAVPPLRLSVVVGLGVLGVVLGLMNRSVRRLGVMRNGVDLRRSGTGVGAFSTMLDPEHDGLSLEERQEREEVQAHVIARRQFAAINVRFDLAKSTWNTFGAQMVLMGVRAVMWVVTALCVLYGYFFLSTALFYVGWIEGILVSTGSVIATYNRVLDAQVGILRLMHWLSYEHPR